MKRLLLSTLMLVSAVAYGQTEMQTLMGRTSTLRVTGQGGATAKLTRFNGETSLLTGAYGGAVFNERVFVGGGAYGLTNTIFLPNERNALGQRLRWNLNYGGLMMGFVTRNRRVAHLAGGVLLGGGYVWKNWSGGDSEEADRQENKVIDGSVFFAAEPHLEVELNLLRWMRLGIGGSYRYIAGSDTPGITDKKMSAPAGHLTFKFGRF